MNNDIETVEQEIKGFKISNTDELEAFRLKYLSRNGLIPELLSNIGKAPREQRAELGKKLNALKNLAQNKFENAQQKLQSKGTGEIVATDDITLQAPSMPLGSYHPITQSLNEIKSIFLRLGFTIADGPELEDDFHNFTALNFPPEHPARDMQDTFFIRKNVDNPHDDLVLRTHTSPVQIRLMENEKPPIRAIMPGRVYRNESITAKSYCLFHQVEALYVDEHVSLAELKETLIILAKMMYGPDVKYRLRPSFFPFTEPSLEMDVWWGSKDEGQWLEILGAGMVDPNVLKAVNIDPEKYSGYAVGIGVERIALLKYQINDIRLLYDNDLRFLNQFK
ncbi:MAG TPA: phenylalanine--tRNA ligase subunit alpha [Balneolales bacterium]|nr:phenylalanine--tRNA ligase subunit alpha [Balneolales bacterium]